MIDSLGGRRFLLAALTLLICSVMRSANWLSDGGYITIILGTVAAYITAGTWDNHVEVQADARKSIAVTQANAGQPVPTPVSNP